MTIKNKIILFLFIAIVVSVNLQAKAIEKTIKTQIKQAKTTMGSHRLSVPSWKELSNFSFPSLKYGATTINQFLKLYPEANNKEEEEHDAIIYQYKPEDTSSFSQIKFGFQNKVLVWIDFYPAEIISSSDFLKAYGAPLLIERNISNYLDYYYYKNFAITVPKEKEDVYTFTQFEQKVSAYNKASTSDMLIPSLSSIKTGTFDKFQLGKTKTSSIKELYPNIKKIITDEKGIFTTIFVEDDTQNSNIKLLEFLFYQNKLSYIGVIPHKIYLDTLLNLYDTAHKLNEAHENYYVYYLDNMEISVDKKSKMVLRIDLTKPENEKLLEILPVWKNLNNNQIKQLKINETSEKEFNEYFPDLMAEKKALSTTQIYTVREGISSTGFDSVYFVFKNKILSSIDFILNKNVSITELLKVFGDDYELDNESDDKSDYYIFENVIVSVSKKSHIVNSMGLL